MKPNRNKNVKVARENNFNKRWMLTNSENATISWTTIRLLLRLEWDS